MNQYKKGEIVTGCVTGIEKYGIFVNKIKFCCDLDFANPRSRGVCWGKNFLQNHFLP